MAVVQEEFGKALRLSAQLAQELSRLLGENQQRPRATQRSLLAKLVGHAEALEGEIGIAQAQGRPRFAPAHCRLCAIGAGALGAAAAQVDPTEEHFMQAHVVPCLSRGQRAPGTSVPARAWSA